MEGVLEARAVVLDVGGPQVLIHGADHSQLRDSREIVQRIGGQSVGREAILQKEWRWNVGGQELPRIDQERRVELQKAFTALAVKGLVEESATAAEHKLV